MKVTLKVERWYKMLQEAEIQVDIPDTSTPEQAKEKIKEAINDVDDDSIEGWTEEDDWQEIGRSHLGDEWKMAEGAETPALLANVPTQFPHKPSGWMEETIWAAAEKGKKDLAKMLEKGIVDGTFNPKKIADLLANQLFGLAGGVE